MGRSGFGKTLGEQRRTETYDEQIGDHRLYEKDRRFHDTEHRGDVVVVQIGAVLYLGSLVGKVEADGIDDLMLWQEGGGE